jgi:ankyrin repeat protein
MKLRLDHLRRCKRGRISKQKRLRSRAPSRDAVRIEAFRGSRPNSIASHGRLAHAFRDYTVLSSYDIPIMLSPDLVDSEPVSSSLLLLDGSSLSTAPNHVGSCLIGNIEPSHKLRLDMKTSATSEPIISSTITHSKSLEISAKRAGSIRALGKQLADKYSEAYLRHVSSIIRYSSSNSWRSSLTSFSSRTSSFFSRLSVHEKSKKDGCKYIRVSKSTALVIDPLQDSLSTKPVPSIPSEQTEALHFYNRRSTLSSEDGMQPNELEIWNELIDESQLGPVQIPQYHLVSLLKRKCCASLYEDVCGKCGFGPEHRFAVRDGTIYAMYRPFIDRCDFYGNNPLHCAAAATRIHEIWMIRRMIWPGAYVSQVNTFGETFLHILCRNGLRSMSDVEHFLSMLEDLYGTDFPFSKCDYHGRTILHILFQNSKGRGNIYSSDILQRIFRIMKPNLNMRDNAGFRVRDYLKESRSGKEYEEEVASLITSYCFPCNSPRSLTDRIPLSPLSEYWFEDNTKPQFIASINEAGDSPLIAMLKCWEAKEAKTWVDMDLSLLLAEKMIHSGAIIHMRDRNGETGLTIAARCGFRRVVTLLLEHGANVHSRNYRGVGILKQIEQALDQAREAGDETLWSRIWSCHIALVDARAILDPSDQDEWMSPEAARAKSLANMPRFQISKSVNSLGWQ